MKFISRNEIKEGLNKIYAHVQIIFGKRAKSLPLTKIFQDCVPLTGLVLKYFDLFYPVVHFFFIDSNIFEELNRKQNLF